MNRTSVFLVGHNVVDLHSVAENIRGLGCQVQKLERSCRDTPQALSDQNYDVLVIESDKFFPLEGADQLLLKNIRACKPAVPIIILCPSGMRQGYHQEVVEDLGLQVVRHDRFSDDVTAYAVGEALIDCVAR